MCSVLKLATTLYTCLMIQSDVNWHCLVLILNDYNTTYRKIPYYVSQYHIVSYTGYCNATTTIVRIQRRWFPCTRARTCLRLLLVHESNFGQMLPPVTHIGTSGSWIQVHWVQVRHLNPGATAAPLPSPLSLLPTNCYCTLSVTRIGCRY